ncbi:hypothetical protein D9M69_508500 [compost metagenome]
MFANRHGTGEGHFANDRMRNAVRGNLGGNPVAQTERTSGNAGISKAAEHRSRSSRSLLRPLDDDRAPRGQSRADFAQNLADREVPRREPNAWPNGFFVGELGDTGQTSRNDTAVGATRFLCEPVDQVSSGVDLHTGFGQRLTLFQGNQRGDFLNALTEQRSGATHDFAAFKYGDILPRLEAGLSGLKYVIEVRTACMRNASDDLSSSRVDYILPAPFGTLAPHSVDEQTHCWISHANSCASHTGSASWSLDLHAVQVSRSAYYFEIVSPELLVSLTSASSMP